MGAGTTDGVSMFSMVLIIASTNIFVVLQFGIQSLINWQTWAVFAVSVNCLSGSKKDVVWLILGTGGVSFLVFEWIFLIRADIELDTSIGYNISIKEYKPTMILLHNLTYYHDTKYLHIKTFSGMSLAV
jgi:hypothetical protein